MSLPKDLSGQRFGMLTAIERVGSSKKGTALWKCVCDCGKETIVRTYALTSHSINSCGCTRADKCRGVNGIPHPKLTKTRISMIRRCYDKRQNAYKYYGARGIKVCDEWLNPTTGHDNFIIWALNNGYRDDLTIDRIDVDGDYCPENCRWVNRSVQAFNKHERKSKLGIRVVAYNTRQKKYIARISADKKRIFLGYYSTIEEAVSAREQAEIKYYGESLNHKKGSATK